MKIVAVILVVIMGLGGALVAAPRQVVTNLLPPSALQPLSEVSSYLVGLSVWIRDSARPTSGPGETSFRLADVQSRSIADVISTTGTITPVALVNISSLVSGQVNELLVDFNSDVKQGDPLAILDPTTFQNARLEAEAELAIGQANVLKAQITLQEANADAGRKRTLFSSGSSSFTDESKSIAARDLAAAELQASNAVVKKAQAAANEARTNLDRATIRSPVDGTIINRNVEIGQVLAVSLATPTLFTIAKDLRAMQLDALVSEGDIGRVRVGQRVSFTVDAYPQRSFEGDVAQIRKQPMNSQNVVLYTVIVSAPNPERLLLPGMTATTRIIVDQRPATLAVPNAALRVHVSDTAIANSSRIFVEREGRAIPVSIKSLASDNSYTQVESGELRVGDRVVVGIMPRAANPVASRGLIGVF